MEGTQGGCAGPGFAGGSTDGVDDEADGDVKFLMQLAAKLKRDGRDPIGGLG